MIESKSINQICYYEIDGHGPGKKILIFLPGIGSKKENYIVHLNSFIACYETIYAIDLPEQGSKGEWRIGVMVDNLKEFIRLMVTDNDIKIDLAGHSAGALSILSFIFNYNGRIENYILDFMTTGSQDLSKTMFELKQHGFLSVPQEAKNVERLLLYSIPLYLNTRSIISLCNHLKNRDQKSVKKLLNWIVNYPLKLFRLLMKKPLVDFEISKSARVQYFNLLINDHHSFCDYISRYPTIFTFMERKYIPESDINEVVANRNILIQYGSFDWLSKHFSNNPDNPSTLFRFHEKVTVKKHFLLGHFLRKKLCLDVNLNTQMLTNQNVILNSTKLIKGHDRTNQEMHFLPE